MSSCRPNRSPSDDCTVCDVSSVPPGASTSCATARSWSPERSSVPMTTRSTSASAASALRSGASPAKRAADRARAHDQRADRRERRGDRVRQAEGEEVGLGIRPQHAERQHDEARQRVRQRRRRRRRRCRGSRAAPRPSPRRTPADRPAAWPAPGGSRDRRRPPPASRVSAGGCSCSVACRTSTIAAAGERRAAREHLEEDRAGGEQIAARVDRLAGRPARAPCSAACPSRCRCASGRPPSRGAGVDLGPRQAEVEQLHAVRRQEHVRRLEVAVDDAARVERGERREDAERRSGPPRPR